MDGRNPVAARLDEVQQVLRKQVVRVETDFHLGIRGDDAQQLGRVPPEARAGQILDAQLRADPRRLPAQYADRSDAVPDTLLALPVRNRFGTGMQHQFLRNKR